MKSVLLLLGGLAAYMWFTWWLLGIALKPKGVDSSTGSDEADHDNI